jgi:hypothetical protein
MEFAIVSSCVVFICGRGETQTAVEAQNPRRRANPSKKIRWTWAGSQETSHLPSLLEVDTEETEELQIGGMGGLVYEEDGFKNLQIRFTMT